jgi:hypothetical protein
MSLNLNVKKTDKTMLGTIHPKIELHKTTLLLGWKRGPASLNPNPVGNHRPVSEDPPQHA